MSRENPFEYEEKNSKGNRFGFLLGVLVVLGLGGFVVYKLTGHSSAPQRRETEMVMIKPPPATPPPPPPQPPQQVPKQQQDEQTQVTEQDMTPAETPQSDPGPALGTGVTGNGPGDSFGLGGRDNRQIGGSGSGGGGSRYGAYFSSVVKVVGDALSKDPVASRGVGEIKVKLWSDPTGRVTKVKLLGSTGDPKLDEAIRTKALIGCQLPDIPSGMKMPLELKLKLRRPN